MTSSDFIQYLTLFLIYNSIFLLNRLLKDRAFIESPHNEFQVQFYRGPIYIAGDNIISQKFIYLFQILGKYLKFNRTISNTPFSLPNGTKLSKSSVEEIILSNLLPHFKAESIHNIFIIIIAYRR